MIKYYLNAVQNNYANFSGRARRSEYWYFMLCYYIISILAIVLDSVLGSGFQIEGISLGYGWITLAIALGHIIPSLALLVRRLHDVGKSGWFYFIVLIPLIGAIWLLVLECTEGTKGDNNYGADPKA